MGEGKILKALSGFYFVAHGDDVIRCKPRGVFRHEGATPLVGDDVRYLADGGDGVITEILPRRNSLHRPPVANIDQLVLVIAAVTPVADPFLVDKMVCFAEFHHIEPVICLNKADLGTNEKLTDRYAAAGYPVCIVSAETGEGMDRLHALLRGKVSAFAGNSGVGKSSLINRLCPELSLRTGEVSEKLGRGRHTTRHVELFALQGGGLMADTPGFSFFDPDSLDLPEPQELWRCFREFLPFGADCRYADCSHTKEQGCGILRALREGQISRERHQSYCRMYEEAKKLSPWERRQLAKQRAR